MLPLNFCEKPETRKNVNLDNMTEKTLKKYTYVFACDVCGKYNNIDCCQCTSYRTND